MHFSRVIAIGCVAALGLAGCQTTPSSSDNRSCRPLPGYEKSNSNTTNAAIGAAIGAVAGGVIGNVSADHRTRGTRNGALIGALAGALAGSQYNNVIGLSEEPDGSVRMEIPGAVLFASGKSDISPSFRPTLDDVAATIREYCDITAVVVGHTDSTGGDSINIPLSQNRAGSVVSYLVGPGGVEQYRLSAQGVGSSQPIASNNTVEGRAQNRRVEIYIRPPQGV